MFLIDFNYRPTLFCDCRAIKYAAKVRAVTPRRIVKLKLIKNRVKAITLHPTAAEPEPMGDKKPTFRWAVDQRLITNTSNRYITGAAIKAPIRAFALSLIAISYCRGFRPCWFTSL